MKPFKDCRYSAFVSYAHADDEAHSGWVTKFSEDLERILKGRLKGAAGPVFPPMHLSGRNGPVAGSLTLELQQRIADSFAMVIVVHDAYVQSEWCLKELAFFKSLFGDQGFLERLYIVALSQPAMLEVTAKPEWAALTLDDQLWIPFFKEDEPDRPMRRRLDSGDLTERFEAQLERLLKRLVPGIKQSSSRTVPPPRPTASAAAALTTGGAEANLLFGVPAPELADAVAGIVGELRAAGVTVASVATDSLMDDFPEFDAADTLILPYGSGGTNLRPFKSTRGGHLAAQRDAWLNKGRPAAGLHWLDLRHVACATPPGPGHAELVGEVAGQSLSPDSLRRRFAPPPRPAAGRADERAPGRSDAADDSINIYIESNQHDVDLWEDLGERIKAKWDELLRQSGDTDVPSLSLHARGLPLQRIEEERLDDADGVVLLWGKKPGDSLRAQIRKVEGRLPRRDPPPGIVAYLIPQQPDPQQTVEATFWKVLRFQDADSSNIDIVPAETDRLHKFLAKILERARKRLGATA